MIAFLNSFKFFDLALLLSNGRLELINLLLTALLNEPNALLQLFVTLLVLLFGSFERGLRLIELKFERLANMICLKLHFLCNLLLGFSLRLKCDLGFSKLFLQESDL